MYMPAGNWRSAVCSPGKKDSHVSLMHYPPARIQGTHPHRHRVGRRKAHHRYTPGRIRRQNYTTLQGRLYSRRGADHVHRPVVKRNIRVYINAISENILSGHKIGSVFVANILGGYTRKADTDTIWVNKCPQGDIERIPRTYRSRLNTFYTGPNTSPRRRKLYRRYARLRGGGIAVHHHLGSNTTSYLLIAGGLVKSEGFIRIAHWGRGRTLHHHISSPPAILRLST